MISSENVDAHSPITWEGTKLISTELLSGTSKTPNLYENSFEQKSLIEIIQPPHIIKRHSSIEVTETSKQLQTGYSTASGLKM